MACPDTLPTKADLEKVKRQSEFIATVGTGKNASGVTVTSVVNPDTGETVPTIPYAVSQIGGVIAFDFATGGTIELRNEFVQDATFGVWQWTGVIPHVVAPGTDPTLDATWVQIYTKNHEYLAGLNPADGSAHNADDIAYMPSVTLLSKIEYMNEFDDLSSLSSSSVAENGVYVRVKNIYGVEHVRIISATNDGSGVLLASGKYANLVVINPNTIYASQLGLIVDGDYTTLFNVTILPFIDANNITEIVLDTGDITVTTTLNIVYGGVTFSGSGKLQSNNLNNMLQRVNSQRTNLKQYHGSYNVGAIFNQAFKAAALKKGEVRVVLFGDSISVGNDYDSFNTPAAGFTNVTGVDNIDRHNCLAAQIYTELVAAIPKGTRVKFYSRSIGGLGYGSIDTAWDSLSGLFAGREQATSGKSWRDCVLDLNPDLVIHSMGMNETPTSYVDNFISKWNNYLITAQKVGTFDQVIITTPNPNFNDALQFGDFRDYDLNASKFYVAHLQRYIARYYGYSLIDVAFNSNLKRYGFDPRSCTFNKTDTQLTFTDGSQNKTIQPGSGVSNAEFTPPYQPIYHSTTFTISPSVDSDIAGFDFKFTAGSVILQFTSSNLLLFTANYPASLGALAVSTGLVMYAGQSYTFTLTVTPSGAFVYFNNELVLVNNSSAYSATLPMFFSNAVGGVDVTVSSGVIRGPQFARYASDTLTNGEMYGDLAFQSNPFGGGINHPSTVGLSEIYLPPVRERLSDMLTSSVEYTTILGGTLANEMVFVGRILDKQYNRVTMYEYGSARELVLRIGAGSTYTVDKNTGGNVSMYLDTSDMSLFMLNTNESILQFEFTGEWLIKQPTRMGINTPRGTLLSTVA